VATSNRKTSLLAIGLNGNRHLCAFFHSEDEEFRTPFMVDGLAAGEKVVYLVDVNNIEQHRRRLKDGGVDVEALDRDAERFGFRVSEQTYIVDLKKLSMV
jgi:hypothetical protein